jgi:hypothetical protein
LLVVSAPISGVAGDAEAAAGVGAGAEVVCADTFMVATARQMKKAKPLVILTIEL